MERRLTTASGRILVVTEPELDYGDDVARCAPVVPRGRPGGWGLVEVGDRPVEPVAAP